jgi:hypothetical protein
LNSQPFTHGRRKQGRRPPSNKHVDPEVYELLRRTRRVLRTNGYRLKPDPLNPLGDGRSWILIFEPTGKIRRDADPVDLVSSLLEAESVEFDGIRKLENGTFGVALRPPARRLRVPEPPAALEDPYARYKLLREFEGLDPGFLTTPVSSNREIIEQYMRTHGGETPTLEYVMGEALSQAKNLVADCLPPTLPRKTMRSEHDVASVPLPSHTDIKGPGKTAPFEAELATNDPQKVGVARAIVVEKIRREIYAIIQRIQLREDYDENIRGGKGVFSGSVTVSVCDQHHDLCDKLCLIPTTKKPKILALACEIAARANDHDKSVRPITFQDAQKRYGKKARKWLNQRQ